MKVILANVLGYCMGVRRAVENAMSALEMYKNKKVYSLGPLIHNKTALDSLAEKGLLILEENDISKVDNESVVIIRAHGVSPIIMQELSVKKCIIINATCPRVVASQKMSKKYADENYTVILAGDKNHGEVTGIAGYAGKSFVLVQDNNEALTYIKENSCKNAILLSQTTFSPVEFEKISNTLSRKIDNLKIMNTICPATRERQEALLKLCPKVEGILVVGGKNSANTKRLLQTASENCENAILIESADEIPNIFFQMKVVGITAGASTPDNVIQSVEEKLNMKK